MKKIFLVILFFASISASAHKDKWDTYKQNWSPLMLAIYNGETEEFTKLIKNNVDINYIVIPKQGSRYQLTALEVAIRVDNVEAINALIGTNKISRINEALFTASGYERVSTIQALINHGANPNYANEFGHSVLMFAVSFGSNEVIESLISNGSNINQAKPNGMTALILACYGSKVEKIKLLLKLGAEKDLKDSKGLTALDYFNKYCNNGEVSDENKTEIRELLK